MLLFRRAKQVLKSEMIVEYRWNQILDIYISGTLVSCSHPWLPVLWSTFLKSDAKTQKESKKIYLFFVSSRFKIPRTKKTSSSLENYLFLKFRNFTMHISHPINNICVIYWKMVKNHNKLLFLDPTISTILWTSLVRSGPTPTLSFSNWPTKIQPENTKCGVHCRPSMYNIVEDWLFRTLCKILSLRGSIGWF